MEKEITSLQDKIATITDHLTQEVSSSTMDLIDELVQLNLLLELECNK